jgi:hypothetical protein
LFNVQRVNDKHLTVAREQRYCIDSQPGTFPQTTPESGSARFRVGTNEKREWKMREKIIHVSLCAYHIALANTFITFIRRFAMNACRKDVAQQDIARI